MTHTWAIVWVEAIDRSDHIMPERSEMTYWQPLTSLSRVARQGQTYRNILYLLLTFPLGLTYFIVLVTGLSTGVGLAIIGVGLLLLFLTFGFAWAMAAVERY